MTNLENLDDELFWLYMTSKYDVTAFRKNDEIHLGGFIQTHKPLTDKYKDILLQLIDKDGRFTEYCEGFLEDHIKWVHNDNFKEKHFPLDIGSVFLLENVLRDADFDPYDCEPTQFGLMLDPSSDSVTTASRRLSKSFSHRIPAFRNCIAYPNHGVQVTEQAWTVAKFWLRDVYAWYQNNPLIQQWSGGKLRKDADFHIEFGNRSFIICYTASTLENLSGIGVHEQIYDEKSLYTDDVARASITMKGQYKKPGRPGMRIRTAGTPYGLGTAFYHDQINEKKLQHFAPIICPMGFKKPLCYNCDFYTVTQYRRGELRKLKTIGCTAELKWNKDGTPKFDGVWKRLPDERYTFDDILDDVYRLGKSLWLQEFMCQTLDYTGNAIPLNLIHHITVDTWEPIYASALPCFVGVDFGYSEQHTSAMTIVGEEESGMLRNLQTICIAPHTPMHTMPGDNRIGVLEQVVGLFRDYPNIQMIVADAMGMGKTLVEEDLMRMCREARSFSNVIAYKTVGESKRFLGKSQLYLSLVKPAWELGRFKTYLDMRLNAEMRAWQIEHDPTKEARPKLHPSKVGKIKTDDAVMSLMYALWGALTTHHGMARETCLVSGMPATDEMSVLERETSL